MKRITCAVVGLSVLMLAARSIGQTVDSSAGDGESSEAGVVTVVSESPVQTALEKAATANGALIVKGFTEAGRIRGDDGATVIVRAVELSDQKRDAKIYGLEIVIQPSASGARAVSSYVDENTIDEAVGAMDSIVKMDRSVTAMMNYRGHYRNAGGLEISNFDRNGARMAAVRTTQVLRPGGQIVWTTMMLRLARLDEVKGLMSAAKESIAAAKAK